jgi:hypothetical protein
MWTAATPFNQRREEMQGLKGVIVVATIIAAAASLGACRKEVAETPLKLGAADVIVSVR